MDCCDKSGNGSLTKWGVGFGVSFSSKLLMKCSTCLRFSMLKFCSNFIFSSNATSRLFPRHLIRTTERKGSPPHILLCLILRCCQRKRTSPGLVLSCLLMLLMMETMTMMGTSTPPHLRCQMKRCCCRCHNLMKMNLTILSVVTKSLLVVAARYA